jgi:hypothetical protein
MFAEELEARDACKRRRRDDLGIACLLLRFELGCVRELWVVLQVYIVVGFVLF